MFNNEKFEVNPYKLNGMLSLELTPQKYFVSVNVEKLCCYSSKGILVCRVSVGLIAMASLSMC